MHYNIIASEKEVTIMANEQKYTTRTIQAINTGMDISKDKKLSTFDIPALLRALYDQEDSFYQNILKKSIQMRNQT